MVSMLNSEQMELLCDKLFEELHIANRNGSLFQLLEKFGLKDFLKEIQSPTDSFRSFPDGKIVVQNCATGKYLTKENGEMIQKNPDGSENQLWSGTELLFVRQTSLKEVTVVPDSICITVDGKIMEKLTLQSGASVQLAVETVPKGALTVLNWSSDSIGHGVVTAEGILNVYEAG